ncbi:hypothetical protein CIB84_008623, partial [Bambusicola thoracicus]
IYTSSMTADLRLTASSDPGRMTSSRLPVLLALVFSSLSPVLSHSNREMWFQDLFPPNTCPVNAKTKTFYGIMFDAGSTGTRIHIYTFVQKSPEILPELEGEIFESVKPGLSAYADQPEKGAESVKRLLDMAIDAVPPHLWKKTPVVLKATAGLRLLSEEKAQALLSEVKEVFEESPFLVPEDSVSIMDGSYEGILAWITVNFLTGQLSGQNQHTVGTLDLGGASTQITFLPRFEVRSGCKHASQDHNASGKTWAQLGSVLSFCQLWHKQNISDVLDICTAFPFDINSWLIGTCKQRRLDK